MAAKCQCIAKATLSKSSLSKIWFRSFTNCRSYAEDVPVSRRAQVQRESADAIQNLARSREQRPPSDFTMRRITLTPASGEISGDAPLPTFERRRELSRAPMSQGSRDSSHSRYSGSRGASRTQRSGQNTGARRQERSRAGGDRGRGGRKSRTDPDDDFEEKFMPEIGSGGDAMTEEEHNTYLKELGHVEKETLPRYPGPHLDMASMMIEYAPRHFGATEPASGQYPSMTDTRSRGLLQDVIKQVRKNETYTEGNIEKLIKKLGPAMPRS